MDGRTINLKEVEDIVRFECGEWEGLAKTIIKRLEALPTVDAVPVRCKDCLHNRACEIQYHAQAGDLFFCGAAERKDGKGNGNETD